MNFPRRAIDVVALDADDTLWHNEPLYRSTREQLRAVLARYDACARLDDALDETERHNLQHFGYGVKGFTLSMIRTGLDLTCDRLEGADVRRILEWGIEMLRSPVELLEGAREAVEDLAGDFRLVLLTKGDLFHQESKLARSGLGHLFSAVEIVSEKDPDIYRAVMMRQRVAPERFLMAGNSLRSDVLPVLAAGGHAVHVPYPITWSHEEVPAEALRDVHYHEVASISELPALVRQLAQRSTPAPSD